MLRVHLLVFAVLALASNVIASPYTDDTGVRGSLVEVARASSDSGDPDEADREEVADGSSEKSTVPLSQGADKLTNSSSKALPSQTSGFATTYDKGRSVAMVCGATIFPILGWHYSLRASPRVRTVMSALGLGLFYILVSSLMIESNKWLMAPTHFPYPLALTMCHMGMSFLLANVARLVMPSMFPAFAGLEISPRFCSKFLWIGIPFACSLVCGNWAYKYLSVSFLQIMKQSNIVTIYFLSVAAGLESLRRCNVILLAITLGGSMMGVEGELHFVLVGFLLQVVSSVSEAAKVVVQSLLMSGTTRLDPLTMVLFMAPACLLANMLPVILLEGPKCGEIWRQFMLHWPLVAGNAALAFILNCTVAQCIKQLSAVGYLLCGITKDVCIIVTSTWFLGESLSNMQKLGFTITLSGVASYSLYKQNASCFDDDNLLEGFKRIAKNMLATNERSELPRAVNTGGGKRGAHTQ
eukprot:TRINITY_DN56978_c0_g1_i1.p1 TRINITY_DN56978_c0_g1~~TRINITY_DN56978_c0_g1_i1.p1  ORF type:complete len:496 (-),score=73.67 TRINITY_DN56978_c0_g1_i1:54-1457(-)